MMFRSSLHFLNPCLKPFALLQLAFVACAILGAIVLYKVFQGSSVEGAIRDTKGSVKGTFKEAKGSVKVSNVV